MTQKKVLVGLSGGVDSAVSAYLLKEQGYDVSAGFMINYLTEDDSCPTRTDMAIAKEVAEYLKIPFFTFDFIEEYEQKVLNYIFEGYKKGLTPNPDVFCNTWIKFDLFREEALSYGFDAVATGHYARIGVQNKKEERRNKKAGIIGSDNSELVTRNSSLLRGIDPDKDQSYFLAALSREQLQQAIFPIGNLPKSEVRNIARKAGLPNAERKDSQGLCFVGKVDFAAFLKSHIPAEKGLIIDTSGKKLGEHDGAFQYTIGQRKGIGVGGGPALYVVEKNVETNTLIVGKEDDPRLLSTTCTVGELNWLEDVILPRKCEAQIRYRQMPQKCTLTEIQNTKYKIQNLETIQNTKYKVQNVEDPSRVGEGIATNSPLEGGGGTIGRKSGVSEDAAKLSLVHEGAEQQERNGGCSSGGTPPNPLINEGESVAVTSSDNPSTHPPINQSTVIQVSFDVPQRAITPGQVCVFYDGDIVLGSGIILS